jgi:hypothetical protein
LINRESLALESGDDAWERALEVIVQRAFEVAFYIGVLSGNIEVVVRTGGAVFLLKNHGPSYA